MNESSLPPALRSGSPALFKRMISLSLRTWRKEAEMTQADGAKRLGRTAPHIHKLEAVQLPTVVDLELLLQLYGKADRIPFMRELLAAARKPRNWWSEFSSEMPGWFDLFMGLEA